MKLHRLDQTLRCHHCKHSYLVRLCHRVMNFTSGEVGFFCQNCRSKIIQIGFAKWNELHRDFFDPQPEKRVAKPRPEHFRRHRR